MQVNKNRQDGGLPKKLPIPMWLSIPSLTDMHKAVLKKCLVELYIAQPIIEIYEEIFSEYSYGFRPGRSCHDAIKQALNYLNDGNEWVIDIDIEQFFDKVNHDKLIQILREEVNDSTTLNLILCL